MAPVRRFEDLEVWKAARTLTKFVHELTAGPSFKMEWNLRGQLRDAASSSMSNCAEGFEAGSDREFRRFLCIAKRSAAEVQSHLYEAIDHALITQAQFDEGYNLARQVKKLAAGLIRYLTTGKQTPAGESARRNHASPEA